jgi:hypothetical protein
LAAFQCHRNHSLGRCDAEVARGGAIGWVQPKEGNLLGLFSTRVSAEEHGEGVFLRAECVIKTVGDDDTVVFRLWGKTMLAEESLWTISQCNTRDLPRLQFLRPWCQREKIPCHTCFPRRFCGRKFRCLNI